MVLPSLHTLKSSVRDPEEVDRRLEELKQLNLQGNYKSQRGGNEVVWCKKEVLWPQNFILSGSTKSRTTYDSLTMSLWVSGFTHIIREETELGVKHLTLDYLADLMKDSHEFGGQTAMGVFVGKNGRG